MMVVVNRKRKMAPSVFRFFYRKVCRVRFFFFQAILFFPLSALRIYWGGVVSVSSLYVLRNNCDWGRGCTHVMHVRSRVTIDPRIPTMPGRSIFTSRHYCLHQARSAVKCWASRSKVNCICYGILLSPVAALWSVASVPSSYPAGVIAYLILLTNTSPLRSGDIGRGKQQLIQ